MSSVLSPFKGGPDSWTSQIAKHHIVTHLGSNPATYPAELADVNSSDPSKHVMLELKYSALAGFFSYMQYTLRLESVIRTSDYIPCDFDKKSFAERMTLDSQALTHLEILENSQAAIAAPGSQIDTRTGTVLNYLDYTKTPYGKRMLHKWVCAPLVDIAAINDRLDALEDIQNNIQMKEVFSANIG